MLALKILCLFWIILSLRYEVTCEEVTEIPLLGEYHTIPKNVSEQSKSKSLPKVFFANINDFEKESLSESTSKDDLPNFTINQRIPSVNSFTRTIFTDFKSTEFSFTTEPSNLRFGSYVEDFLADDADNTRATLFSEKDNKYSVELGTEVPENVSFDNNQTLSTNSDIKTSNTEIFSQSVFDGSEDLEVGKQNTKKSESSELIPFTNFKNLEKINSSQINESLVNVNDYGDEMQVDNETHETSFKLVTKYYEEEKINNTTENVDVMINTNITVDDIFNEPLIEEKSKSLIKSKNDIIERWLKEETEENITQNILNNSTYYLTDYITTTISSISNKLNDDALINNTHSNTNYVNNGTIEDKQFDVTEVHFFEDSLDDLLTQNVSGNKSINYRNKLSTILISNATMNGKVTSFNNSNKIYKPINNLKKDNFNHSINISFSNKDMLLNPKIKSEKLNVTRIKKIEEKDSKNITSKTELSHKQMLKTLQAKDNEKSELAVNIWDGDGNLIGLLNFNINLKLHNNLYKISSQPLIEEVFEMEKILLIFSWNKLNDSFDVSVTFTIKCIKEYHFVDEVTLRIKNNSIINNQNISTNEELYLKKNNLNIFKTKINSAFNGNNISIRMDDETDIIIEKIEFIITDDWNRTKLKDSTPLLYYYKEIIGGIIGLILIGGFSVYLVKAIRNKKDTFKPVVV